MYTCPINKLLMIKWYPSIFYSKCYIICIWFLIFFSKLLVKYQNCIKIKKHKLPNHRKTIQHYLQLSIYYLLRSKIRSLGGSPMTILNHRSFILILTTIINYNIILF